LRSDFPPTDARAPGSCKRLTEKFLPRSEAISPIQR
jgi:hypothetical protein